MGILVNRRGERCGGVGELFFGIIIMVIVFELNVLSCIILFAGASIV